MFTHMQICCLISLTNTSKPKHFLYNTITTFQKTNKLPKLQTTTPMILSTQPHHMISRQAPILIHSHLINDDTHLFAIYFFF